MAIASLQLAFRIETDAEPWSIRNLHFSIERHGFIQHQGENIGLTSSAAVHHKKLREGTVCPVKEKW
jgi:hypothetical protein